MKRLSRYRIEERAEVMRVYEIDATSEDAAVEIMFSGTVEPIDLHDVDSVITVKKMPRRETSDDNV